MDENLLRLGFSNRGPSFAHRGQFGISDDLWISIGFNQWVFISEYQDIDNLATSLHISKEEAIQVADIMLVRWQKLKDILSNQK